MIRGLTGICGVRLLMRERHSRACSRKTHQRIVVKMGEKKGMSGRAGCNSSKPSPGSTGENAACSPEARVGVGCAKDNPNHQVSGTLAIISKKQNA